jgi:hypothetical protein
VLHAQFGLGDQQVFVQGGQPAVVGELGPAVVGLGGSGEDLGDEDGIQQCIDLVVFE